MIGFASRCKKALFLSPIFLLVGVYSQAILANSLLLDDKRDKIVAIVNDDVITHKELGLRISRLTLEKRLSANIGDEDRRGVLESMAQELVLAQQAERSRVVVSDIEMNHLMQQYINRVGISLPVLKRELKTKGSDYSDLVAEIKTTALIKKMIRREVVRGISIGQKEVDEFIKANNIQPRVREYDLTHLFIQMDVSQGEEFERNVADIVNQNDFKSLKYLLTRAGFAVNQKERKSQTIKQLPTVFESTVKGLRIGEKSDLILTSAGAHVLQLNNASGASSLVEKRKANHILVKANSKLELARAMQTVNRLREQLRQGAVFSDLATYYSDDSTSAALGGDLGWVRKGQMVPEFEKTLFSLSEGQVSEPVTTAYGVHLIKLNEVSVSSDPDDEVREIAFNALMSRKVDQFYPVWLSKLVGDSYIKYFE